MDSINMREGMLDTMTAHFLTELLLAITVAVVMVRYWKVIVATLTAFVITFTVVGVMTVMNNLPWQ